MMPNSRRVPAPTRIYYRIIYMAWTLEPQHRFA